MATRISKMDFEDKSAEEGEDESAGFCSEPSDIRHRISPSIMIVEIPEFEESEKSVNQPESQRRRQSKH